MEPFDFWGAGLQIDDHIHLDKKYVKAHPGQGGL